MTAYAAPAFAGMTWPLAFVPRAVKPDPSLPAAARCRSGGNGGTAGDGDGQVIAGGGGNGAPLFSRPQPQSRGSTPGGVRRTRTGRRPEKRGRERDHRPATMPRQESTSPPTEPRSPGRPTARAPRDAGLAWHRWRRRPARGPGNPGERTDQGAARPPLGPLAEGSRRRPPRETPCTRRAKDRHTSVGALDPGAAGPDAASTADGVPIQGRVVEDPRVLGARPGTILAAAPGLRAARPADGTRRPPVALGIGGGLVLVAAVGVAFERRRPKLTSPTAPSGAFVFGGAT